VERRKGVSRGEGSVKGGSGRVAKIKNQTLRRRSYSQPAPRFARRREENSEKRGKHKRRRGLGKSRTLDVDWLCKTTHFE